MKRLFVKNRKGRYRYTGTAGENIKKTVKRILFPVPSRLSMNFIRINADNLLLIEKSIKENYHTGWRNRNGYSEKGYTADLQAHLSGRLEKDRRMIIPWLDNAGVLKNKRILEIGCGTGSSSVAIAEQGAEVTGIDLDEGALAVARDRSKIYGVHADFFPLNAKEIAGAFPDNAFDIIIFFASLEHMTIEERLASLKAAWKILTAKGFLVIAETPNRLWYFDIHTSMLPFFNWLPDELAFAYAKYSDKENFRDLYKEYTPASREHFLRRGRGVSYHEIDIAIGPVTGLNVISSLSTFRKIRFHMLKSKPYRRYKSLLMRLCPNIHEGFFDHYLNVIIQKNSDEKNRL